jgi:hypothetical protein
MKSIHTCTARQKDALLTTRAILQNWVQYAMGQRLASIKVALPPFYEARHGQPTKASVARSQTSRSHSPSTQSGTSTAFISASVLFVLPAQQDARPSSAKKAKCMTNFFEIL